jgi:4a-hydroxytetrahydrobiopterin dehydratase
MVPSAKQGFRIENTIAKELKGLPDWEIVGRELTKGFYLDTFNYAIGFINSVAKVANDLQHHPDILLSEFSTVRLFIKTNEFGKVTEKDVKFAKGVEREWRAWRKYEKKTW